MSLFDFDRAFRAEGYGVIAGIDEAGRGSLAGPVVAACISFKDNVFIEGLQDSKKLTVKKRERLFHEILNNAFVGIGIVDVDTIDRFNILYATRLAMRKAFENLGRKIELLLVDAVFLPEIEIQQKTLIKGDLKSASIAAASIVAKVTRDKIMLEYHESYPYYQFDKHKGYATQQHLKALRKIGPSPIHRKSFSHVIDLMLF
jgi:ribonuclease HII